MQVISFQTSVVRGIVTDSNNIFLWLKSEDINLKNVIFKISVDPDSDFFLYNLFTILGIGTSALLHRLLARDF